MRFDSQVVYPHPVLRPDVEDYKDGDFEVTNFCEVSADGAKVEFTASYDLSVPELAELVKNEDAVVGLWIKCRDTFYQSIFPLEENEETKFVVEGGCLHGEVMVVPIIYATSFIKNFASDDFADDFRGLCFDFSPGDFLAHDTPYFFWLEREAFQPVEAIITLTTIDSKKGFEWDIALDEDQIKIQVSKELSELIQLGRNNPMHTLVLINSIYFSALQSAIEYLQRIPDIEYKWSNVIKQKCIMNDIADFEVKESHIIAQRLLDRPIEKLAKSLFRENI